MQYDPISGIVLRPLEALKKLPGFATEKATAEFRLGGVLTNSVRRPLPQKRRECVAREMTRWASSGLSRHHSGRMRTKAPYVGGPAPCQASCKGSANAAGSARAAQNPAELNEGCNARTRDAAVFASSSRPSLTSGAARKQCEMLKLGPDWMARLAAFAASSYRPVRKKAIERA